MTDQAPETFYSATVVPYQPRPRLLTDIDTGVCIIGGGFAGLWTARALARRGYDVVLLESRSIAGEASGRNGGIVSAGYAEQLQRIIDRVGLDHARELYALSREGIELMRSVIAEGVPGVDPVPGRLNVWRYEGEEAIRRQAEFLGEHFGHEMLVWPKERVRETLRSERYFQALHDADAFSIHPLNLALALATEIESLGGRIYEETAAIAADLDGVRKTVLTSAGRVRAHQVVFCGSACIGETFPALAHTVLPVSTYMCVTTPMADKLAETIRYGGGIVDTRRAGDYYRIVGDRLLWGGRITTRSARPRRLARLMARDIERIYPQFKSLEIEYAWPGVMGYAVHRMPQIGLLRQGAWIASAFGGHGLNNCAIAGELIASAIADRDDRWRLFIPFGLVWAGGKWGRRLTQVAYWSMQVRDWIDEIWARRAERRAVRRRAAAAALIRAKEKEKIGKAAAEKRAQKAAEKAERLAKAEEAKMRELEPAKRETVVTQPAEEESGAMAAGMTEALPSEATAAADQEKAAHSAGQTNAGGKA